MEKKNDYRLVIDSNIYLSYLIGKQLKALELIEKLVNELKLKITHPKFKKYFDHKTALAFVDFLVERSIHINIESDVTMCRDAKGNYLPALAKDANAHFLITGDEDLLILTEFGNTKIIRFKNFMDNHFITL